MTTQGSNQKKILEEKFDKLWPNLYTVVPGLGQGDARPAVKRFISEALEAQRQEYIKALRERKYSLKQIEEPPTMKDQLQMIGFNYGLDYAIDLIDQSEKKGGE